MNDFLNIHQAFSFLLSRFSDTSLFFLIDAVVCKCGCMNISVQSSSLNDNKTDQITAVVLLFGITEAPRLILIF